MENYKTLRKTTNTLAKWKITKHYAKQLNIEQHEQQYKKCMWLFFSIGIQFDAHIYRCLC
jgi:hypothetical protein